MDTGATVEQLAICCLSASLSNPWNVIQPCKSEGEYCARSDTAQENSKKRLMNGLASGLSKISLHHADDACGDYRF